MEGPGFGFQSGHKVFFLETDQAGSGAHPAFCSAGKGDLVSGIKRPDGHSLLSRSELKNEWSFTSTLLNVPCFTL